MRLSRDPDPPFDFIFDYLFRIEIEVKPFFGMFAIYANSKLLLMLRERNNEPEKNGIWIATVGDGVETLRKELPGSVVLFERKSKKDEWLFIPSGDDAFERSAISLCELIVRRDSICIIFLAIVLLTMFFLVRYGSK